MKRFQCGLSDFDSPNARPSRHRLIRSLVYGKVGQMRLHQRSPIGDQATTIDSKMGFCTCGSAARPLGLYHSRTNVRITARTALHGAGHLRQRDKSMRCLVASGSDPNRAFPFHLGTQRLKCSVVRRLRRSIHSLSTLGPLRQILV